jgi:hypothetical protein
MLIVMAVIVRVKGAIVLVGFIRGRGVTVKLGG